MIKQFFPTKDTTIYECIPLLNSGLDQILELTKTEFDNSRILIQFDIDDIQNYIVNNNIQNYNFKLKLTSIDSRELPIDYTLYIYPVSQSWTMGTGKRDILPIIAKDSSWIYRTDTEIWEGSQHSLIGNINDFYVLYNVSGSLTASYYGEIYGKFIGTIYSNSLLIESDGTNRYFLNDTIVNEFLDGNLTGQLQGIYSGSINSAISGSAELSYSVNAGGGTYIDNVFSTQSFSYQFSDIDADVTNIVSNWLSGSYNNGFLIKLSDAEESRSSSTSLQFYSRDTHTIYPPKLELYWDDSSFITSSIIDTYTMSYMVHTYQQSETQLSDLSFAYVGFDTPLLPSYAKYSIIDTWSYQENPVTQAKVDYIKTYVQSYINGNIIANINGLFAGNISGSISGSNVPNGYLELSGSINENLNGKLIATVSGDFLGYINGNLYNKISAYEYYITGSRNYYITESIELKPLIKSNIILYIKNPLSNYSEGSINEIRVFGRERFPNRTYWNKTSYAAVKYLPSSSYYSIRDAQTNDIVIPFDDVATKISCDIDGNYFMFDTSGFQIERMYRFVFKVLRNNMIQYFDNNFLFKIVR